LYDAKETVALAKQFNEVVKSKFKDYSEDQIFNSDQSGFNFEMASNRTLYEVGEKHSSVLMASSSALTHSYTVQPMISLSGDIVVSLLICLQETEGKFGPIVEKGLFRPSNVIVTCTASGKLTKDIVKRIWSDKFYSLLYESKVYFCWIPGLVTISHRYTLILMVVTKFLNYW
jgi:hypothetical protein